MSKKFKKALAFIATAAMAFSATSVLPYSTSGSIVASAASTKDGTITITKKDYNLETGKLADNNITETHKVKYASDKENGHHAVSCTFTSTGTNTKCPEDHTNSATLEKHIWSIKEDTDNTDGTNVTVFCDYCGFETTGNLSEIYKETYDRYTAAQKEIQSINSLIKTKEEKIKELEGYISELNEITDLQTSYNNAVKTYQNALKYQENYTNDVKKAQNDLTIAEGKLAEAETNYDMANSTFKTLLNKRINNQTLTEAEVEEWDNLKIRESVANTDSSNNTVNALSSDSNDDLYIKADQEIEKSKTYVSERVAGYASDKLNAETTISTLKSDGSVLFHWEDYEETENGQTVTKPGMKTTLQTRVDNAKRAMDSLKESLENETKDYEKDIKEVIAGYRQQIKEAYDVINTENAKIAKLYVDELKVSSDTLKEKVDEAQSKADEDETATPQVIGMSLGIETTSPYKMHANIYVTGNTSDIRIDGNKQTQPNSSTEVDIDGVNRKCYVYTVNMHPSEYKVPIKVANGSKTIANISIPTYKTQAETIFNKTDSNKADKISKLVTTMFEYFDAVTSYIDGEDYIKPSSEGYDTATDAEAIAKNYAGTSVIITDTAQVEIQNFFVKTPATETAPAVYVVQSLDSPKLGKLSETPLMAGKKVTVDKYLGMLSGNAKAVGEKLKAFDIAAADYTKQESSK